jgi:predicted permease
MAVRTALGAPRARLVRHLATESILPFAAGGAAGVALAALGTRAFRQAAGDTIPRLGEASVDVTALAFALGLTLATGIVFGVLPAVRFTVPRVAVALRAGRGPRASRERARARSFIVASEVALATLLLASAGLLVRSFQELTAVDPGFRREGVMSFRLELPRTRYADHASVRAFAAALDDRLRQLPGARATGRVVRTPIDQYDFSVGFTIAGRPLPPGERRPVAQVRIASAGYFETMGIRLARGRTFSPRDDAQAPQVVVVNRAMAERYFPGEDPLGERVWLGWSEDGVTRGGEIVGIIENVRQFALDRPAEPELYVAFDQAPVRQMSVVVRSSAEPAALFAAARAAVRDLDPELPLFAFTTLEEKVSRSAARPRLYMSLVAAFALVALALAAIGLYGVVSYGVRQRTQELGVRMALGASPASVVRLVVGGSLRLTLIGALTGIVAAFGATDAMRSLLFGVSPADPWTYAGVFVVLAGVGALASWLPAWRATRIDPVTALRAE